MPDEDDRPSWRKPSQYMQHAPSDCKLLEEIDARGRCCLIDISNTQKGHRTFHIRFRWWPGHESAPGATLQERWASSDKGKSWTWQWSEWSCSISPDPETERAEVLTALGLEVEKTSV